MEKLPVVWTRIPFKVRRISRHELPVVWVDLPFKVVRISRHESEKLYSESLVLHRIKIVLIRQGYDVIKKRMWSDGHMMGNNETQYIRDRKHKFAFYDPDWQIRNLYEDYNNNEEITLAIEKYTKGE